MDNLTIIAIFVGIMSVCALFVSITPLINVYATKKINEQKKQIEEMENQIQEAYNSIENIILYIYNYRLKNTSNIPLKYIFKSLKELNQHVDELKKSSKT